MKTSECNGTTYNVSLRPQCPAQSAIAGCEYIPKCLGNLGSVVSNLPEAWDLCTLNTGRLFYLDHGTQTSTWTPPDTSWTCPYGLPPGWEMAVDTSGKPYYVNHSEQVTTYSDPRVDEDFEVPEPRDVHIIRHSAMGYGFVAGSEKPVVVRFVTEGGPSDQKLLPGDEILAVNNEDVREAEKDHVVKLVRNCTHEVMLTVCQPRSGDDVVDSLCEKLGLCKKKNFALLLEHPQGPRSNKLAILRGEDKLARVAARPGSQHFRCLFRVAFVPNDPMELQRNDPITFDYYYQQCVNDVVAGRFAYEMRYEACLRLAALQMQQVALDTHMTSAAKISLKAMEKEYGLTTFLPLILIENVKRKEIRKHLRYYLKRDFNKHSGTGFPTGNNNNNNLAGGGFASETCSTLSNASSSSSNSIKLKYVHMLSHLPTFGGRIFYVTFKDTNTEMMLQVHPRNGVLVRSVGRCSEPTLSMHFDMMAALYVVPQNEIVKQLTIRLISDPSQMLDFLVDKDDMDDLVLYIQGYYALLTGNDLDTFWEQENFDSTVPPYHGLHSVKAAGWNYGKRPKEAAVQRNPSDPHHKEHLVDLSRGPPRYHDMVNLVSSSQQTTLRPRTPSPPCGQSKKRDCRETTDDTFPQARSRSSVSVEVHADPNDEEDPEGRKMGARFTVGPQMSNSSTLTTESGSLTLSESMKLSQTQEEAVETFGEEDGDEMDHYIALIEKQMHNQRLKKNPSSEEFVCHTFLKAKDSLLIKNRPPPRLPAPTKTKTIQESEDGMPMDVEGPPVARDVQTKDRPATSAPDLSSSDTESLSTPSESPIHRPVKARPGYLKSVSPLVGGKNPSFGLQSPDTLPCSLLSEKEMQDLISSCGIEGEQLEDLLLLFPDNFCTDPEITDLTILPSPKTPDYPKVLDIAAATDAGISPPTPFRDVDPCHEFHNVHSLMQRLAEGDVGVIEDSHQIASKSCSRGNRKKWPGNQEYPEKDEKSGIAVSTRSPSPDSNPRSARQGFPSISNRLAFEEFLAKSIIPPPPPLSLEESRSLLDQTIQSISETREDQASSSSSSEKRVRFSATALVRQRSASGGLERVLAKQRLKERISADKIVSLNKAGKIGRLVESQTFPLPTSNCPELEKASFASPSPSHTEGTDNVGGAVNYLDSANLTDFVYTGKDKEPKRMSDDRLNLPREKELRRTTLHNFSGLESTEFGVPEITRVDLRNFVGLEGLNKGVASLEIKEEERKSEATSETETRSSQSKTGKVKRFFARIRSVDAHSDTSPESSPRKGSHGSSPKKGLQFSPPLLNAIKEKRSKSTEISCASKQEFNTEFSPSEIPDEEVHVQHVSLANYSGLESSPPQSTAQQEQPESLLSSYSSARRRSSQSKGSGGSQDHSAAEEPALGLGNGFLRGPNQTTGQLTAKDFRDAKEEIEEAIGNLVKSVESVPARSPKRRADRQESKQQLKINLLSESQQLAAASKLLVRSATEKHCQILPSLQRCGAKATGMSEAAQSLIREGECSLFQAQSLGAKVREVLKALSLTVDAVKEASGKNLSDPEMKKLMLQSTSLAATLTQLIQCVREHML